MSSSTRFGCPPFPPVPPGIIITPFKEFIPAGYARTINEQGEDIEVDAWAGIPTVKIITEEEALQQKKEKKKRRHAGQCKDETGRLVPWWEEWEQGEHERTMSISFRDGSFVCYADRVYQASDDFRVGRTWPQIVLGVRSIWDHFRLYIGLLTTMPVYRKPKAKERKMDHPDIGHEASDDEGEDDMLDMPRARHTNVSIVQDTLEQIAHPGKQLEPDNMDESSIQRQLLCAFTDDIEKGIKIFLGTYMRESDLIWSEPNLFIAPTVLRFFLRFMLRNDLFYDSPSRTDNLIRAIGVAELAIKELPLTAQIGQTLPGPFDLACIEYWGRKSDRNVHISAVDPVEGEDEACDAPEDLERGVLSVDAPAFTSDDTSAWTDVSVPSLRDLLGPGPAKFLFPTQYAPCIVEHSTRRIRTVIPPDHQYNDARRLELMESESVEAVLEGRFARVVLDPWLRAEVEATEEFQAPVVSVPCSSGPETVSLAHEAYQDAVTVLVEPSHVPLLSVGMGLYGTWIGLGRVSERGGAGRAYYWYIEELVSVFPSFYVN
ncbi:hypothetical protein V8B97DRAFT_1945072 [Scleroderma yunnanense]